MISEKTIAVVVPAYNEESQIGKVIETMPEFVDKIVIVDDKSQDKTVSAVKDYQTTDPRVILIEHKIILIET